MSDIDINTRRRLAAIACPAGMWPCNLKSIGYSQSYELYLGYRNWGCERFYVDAISPSAAQLSQAIADAFARIDQMRAQADAKAHATEAKAERIAALVAELATLRANP